MSSFLASMDSSAYGQHLKSRTKKQLEEMRTYDIWWQELFAGKSASDKDFRKHMPKLLRDLAPSSAFDPRNAWVAEQERMTKANEHQPAKAKEDDGKQKKERRRTGTEDEDAAKGGAGATAEVKVADPEWRKEFFAKITAAKDQIKGSYDGIDSTKADDVYQDGLLKLKKIWDESAVASVKQQKTTLEKKVTALVKDTQKALKKVADEETGGGAKVKKSDLIREKQEAKRQETGLDKDEEKINNVLKKAKHTAVTSLMEIKDKVETPLGRVIWMLAVMGAALKKGDKVMALDCYFSLLENGVFKGAKAELKQRKKERKEAKAKGKKDFKETPLSREASALERYGEVLDQAQGLLKDIDDVIEFQLTEMSNRLPPLSSFTFGRSLDAWQKTVLGLMDQSRSVIVCAPTSAGKTVLSSYITLRAEKILFVVPSEPLVWQVAAMFNKLLAGNVALVTDQFVYNPDRENPRDWKCVVGTPLALESALSKVRGKYGAEMIGKQEYTALRGGFHEFEYVVYDEVHTLDGGEGAALQRIIRAVRCNFLALSATIGNAHELRDWWQTVHDQHIDEELAEIDSILSRNDAPTTREENEDWEMLKRAVKLGYAEITPQHENLAKVRSRWSYLKAQCLERQSQDIFVRTPPTATHVELVDHKARFINLQRWVWTGDRLRTLHPLAAVPSLEYMKNEGFDKASLAFTPYDSYQLWEALNEYFEEDDVEDVDPDDFFEGERITLEKTKQYEDALKRKLQTLAVNKEEATRRLLASFAPRTELNTNVASASDLVLQMKKDDFFPSLFFRLDTYKCTELFVRLLEEMEEAEKTKYPTWYDDLLKKKETEEARVAKMRAELASKEKRKAAKKGKTDEDGNRVERDDMDEEDPESITVEYIDLFQPHPDFTLVSPVNRIPADEMDYYLEELCGEEARKRLDYLTRDHPYIRALRRGMGIYIDDSYSGSYRRIVQQLAQQGKLAVVFSDTSLAFGVNMPFRTTVFYGDDTELLNPLMAAQMSGRAGRRGLDTQGHLLYLGMPFKRIQELMLGCIPAVVGEDPKYPLLGLQHAVSLYNNKVLPNPNDIRFVPLLVDERRARGIGGVSLVEYIRAKEKGTLDSLQDTTNHYQVSFETLQTVGVLSEDKELLEPAGASAFLWEMRQYGAEALALVKLLPFIQSKFMALVSKWTKITRRMWSKAKVDVLEGEFLVLFLAIVDRKRAKEGTTPLHEEDYVLNSKLRSSYLAEVEDRLREQQAVVGQVASPHDQKMLTIDNAPSKDSSERVALDPTLFKLLVMRKTMGSDAQLSALSSQEKYELKARLWKAGSILRTMHNCLQKPGDPYEVIAALLMRKTFVRCKYIMRDTFAYTIFQGLGGTEGGDEDEDGQDDDSDDEEEEEATPTEDAAANGGAEERKV